MSITMVKKRLASGEPCPKCIQAEELLRARGVWERVSRVVWAEENDPESPGMLLGREHGVGVAPFFILEAPGEPVLVLTSALKFVKLLAPPVEPPVESGKANEFGSAELASAQLELSELEPAAVVRWAQARFGKALGIAFSGAEDVVLLDMAVKTGLPFRAFCLDTGRLHPETYRFIERVRTHYGIELEVLSPSPSQVQAMVKAKGLFSFYTEGHQECCGVRKLEPLRRGLAEFSAWMTGQRRDQSPTRSDVSVLEQDLSFQGKSGDLYKLNPLANWTSAEVWDYIREHAVPFNELHERGFISIGCEPCTRATRPGEHERAGRWWWEEATQRECGLHARSPSSDR